MKASKVPVLIPVQTTKKFQLLEFFDIELKVTELLYVKKNEYPSSSNWALPEIEKEMIEKKSLEKTGIYKKLEFKYEDDFDSYVGLTSSDDILNQCKPNSYIDAFNIGGVHHIEKNKNLVSKFLHQKNKESFDYIVKYMSLNKEEEIALKNEMINSGYLIA